MRSPSTDNMPSYSVSPNLSLIHIFVLSGAELELSVFADLAIVGVGAAYILARSAGKYLGAYGGALAMKCEPNIVKYLGVTLLPQAGVALGIDVYKRQCHESAGLT